MPPVPTLILASSSPRRSDLLREAGYRFTVVSPEVAEIEDPAIPIRELTALNAKLKADAVASAYPGAVTIGADTLVLLGDTVFGKPVDHAAAAGMLAELSGRTHQVFTAVSFLYHEGENTTAHALTVATEVTFKSLSRAEVTAYHAKMNPLDKAGGYAAQEHGELIIQRITGSISNVVDLPMDEVATALERCFGIRPGSDRR